MWLCISLVLISSLKTEGRVDFRGDLDEIYFSRGTQIDRVNEGGLMVIYRRISLAQKLHSKEKCMRLAKMPLYRKMAGS